MGISLKLSYIPTIPGILKIVEIVLFLIAFSCAAAFSNGNVIFTISGFTVTVGVSSAYGSASRVEYFVAISVITWIYCLVHFFICLFGIYDNITLFFKSLIVGVIHGVLAFLVLIGASVAASYIGKISSCKFFDSASNTSCGTLGAGCAFGFFGMMALIADAVYHIIKGRSGESAASSGPTHTDKDPQTV